MKFHPHPENSKILQILIQTAPAPPFRPFPSSLPKFVEEARRG